MLIELCGPLRSNRVCPADKVQRTKGGWKGRGRSMLGSHDHGRWKKDFLPLVRDEAGSATPASC